MNLLISISNFNGHIEDDLQLTVHQLVQHNIYKKHHHPVMFALNLLNKQMVQFVPIHHVLITQKDVQMTILVFFIFAQTIDFRILVININRKSLFAPVSLLK